MDRNTLVSMFWIGIIGNQCSIFTWWNTQYYRSYRFRASALATVVASEGLQHAMANYQRK